jgi:hypothetical protein
MTCSVAPSVPSQVLRVCEASNALQAGTACRYNDPFTLANVVISPGAPITFTFTCPTFRDHTIEFGGLFATYSGPVFNNGAPAATITCTRNS